MEEQQIDPNDLLYLFYNVNQIFYFFLLDMQKGFLCTNNSNEYEYGGHGLRKDHHLEMSRLVHVYLLAISPNMCNYEQNISDESKHTNSG